MAPLEKWNPAKELERLRLEFDNLLEQFGAPHGASARDWHANPLRPALDAYSDGEKFYVRIELPGVDPRSVEIKVSGEILAVSGTREEKHESRRRDFYHREIRYGSFEREVRLPCGIKAEDLKANFYDGILELSAEMPHESLPKQVKVEIQQRGPQDRHRDKAE